MDIVTIAYGIAKHLVKKTSGEKNSLKMGFIAVHLTELSSVVFPQKWGNFYFISLISILSIKNIVYMMDVFLLFCLICHMH